MFDVSALGRSLPALVDSEEEALKDLADVATEFKRDFGDKLVSVTLERSDSGQDYLTGTDWQEERR